MGSNSRAVRARQRKYRIKRRQSVRLYFKNLAPRGEGPHDQAGSEPSFDVVDEASAESFPASDPPSFTPGT
jgi:hypothetical protein